MKKIFIIFLVIFLINSLSFAQSDKYSEEYSEECQNYIARKERFNAIYYNALQLTPEQINKYEDITECDKNSYKEKLSEITNEIKKYQIMKECNFSHTKLFRQRQLIRRLHSELSKISRHENRNLKKILTRQQRSIYNTIKHLERHDLKKELHPKDYHKLNPKLPVFGNLE